MQHSAVKWIFLSAAMAVMLGAFGAHALRPLLDASGMHAYETAVQYHFYHSFALMITFLLRKELPVKYIRSASFFFLAGLILFCGSLYTMTFLKGAGFVSAGRLGIITPFGGLSFIAGWIVLFLAYFRSENTNSK
jgi:uncharacterized membrane protein YgdD (TMEM256/DUF423 family)